MRWGRGLLALALVAAVAGTVVQLRTAVPARADVRTAADDTLRTSWDRAEPNLTPSVVTGSNFGQLFATQLDGQLYAQPLVIGDTVVASTETDKVYGLDAVTGAVKWSDDFGPAWPASTIGCGDLVPDIGNTSTGVYDPSSGTVYLTTKVNDGPDAQHPNWYLHAVSATDGAERPGWPVQIVGSPSNDPTRPFQPYSAHQRPGLLLMGGVVYLGFGSHCGYGSYVGWVAGINTNTRAINMWADETGPSSKKAGIWQGGGGLVSDGPGRIFLTSGNGVTAPDGPGASPPGQLSESVVRLGVAADGTLSARDYFSPSNADEMDTNDQDLGAGGPMALPSQYFGTPSVPNLMVEVGKDGRVFLLNRDDLGGKGQGSFGGDKVVQRVGPFRGLWGHPAAYGGEGGWVYYVQNSGTMLAFRYGVNGNGSPTLSSAGNSAETFGYTSGSPLVTSDGTTPGTGVVWVVNVDGPTGANGRLCAYNAVPVGGHLNLLRCFPIGTGVKFSTPASSAGRVYVGTRDGRLYGFGQPVTAALNIPQTDFGGVAVGQTATATVTATAVRPVTVTGVSTSAPFSVPTPPALPVSLAAGESIQVPVTFSPTAPGSYTGALDLSFTDGTAGVLGGALQATAVRPGFAGDPPTLGFGGVVVGASKSLTASFTNTGDTGETVTGVTGPTGPFTASGLPGTGTVVGPGQTVNVSVTYTPTAAGTDTSTISVSGPDGTGTVALSGTGQVGHPELSFSPSSLNFGSVPVGLTATQTLTVKNTGNLNVTITKASPPALPFVVNTPLPEGQVLTPGDSVQIQVTFAPSAVGTFNGFYSISSDDGHGSHDIPVVGTATAPPSGSALPSVLAGGWMFNGSAAMSGSTLALTPAQPEKIGTAIYTTPLPGDGLTASFTAEIGGGTGADGLTFAMLDAARNTPQGIGAGGSALGFGGLPGVAVSLDTYRNSGDPSANFVSILSTNPTGAVERLAAATAIPALRTGTHAVKVSAAGGTLTVWIDGTQVLSQSVHLAPSILPAFTASTGGATDQHLVRNVSISSGPTMIAPPGSGWRFNGTAAMSGASLVLTPARALSAGSVLYSTPVATDGLAASFGLSMNGGTGANGATFALVNPASGGAGSLGSIGSGLGFGGLAGTAVIFSTYPQLGVDSHSFVAVVTGAAGGGLTKLGSSTAVPNLRTGTHNVLITVVGTTLDVAVDGSQILSVPVASLTPTAIVGYTAATGALTDVHTITDAQVVTGATAAGAHRGG
ncbi:hypothetical protein GCM10023322_57720 [Rugosimonospora acidiphila]|uniref:Choice-of-anchor D domain-containing protein n=1 Tax=Rugosimonospora acidiphila TaxID=556531 RepID=A0ABP9SCD0_9ACTN